ncbi:hypothetical protein D9V41_15880 [Aeromicrobium phragmitis]|uniref:Secreted protein n=1 Tax=Aeromicrobium phragmitis TaxID=2478914 RepID=A0A3L8PKE1_9ACTN|nr:hypothetical protein [Aeromicrobium phragmitis]RLV54522.1 hypothetical protein D9V41_15880 [Aeromicrobium phragmitis]
MRKIMKTTAVGAGIGAMVLAGSAAAFASHTSVTVGGSSSPAGPVAVTGTNTSQIGFETDFGVPLYCDTASVEGNVLRGASVNVGNKVGEITDLLFSDCTATALDYPVIVTMSAGDFDVRTHPANAGDPVPVTITGVDAHVRSTGSQPYACEMFAEGSVDAIIHPGAGGVDGSVELVPGSFNLAVTAGDGNGNPSTSSCGGEIWTGDVAQPLFGDFALSTGGAGVISHG